MKMKKLGLLFMMLCMVFAVNAQELKKGDKPYLEYERRRRLERKQQELELVISLQNE